MSEAAAAPSHALALELFTRVDYAECEELTLRLFELVRGYSGPSAILATAYVQAGLLTRNDKALEEFLAGYPNVLRLCSTLWTAPQ